MRLPHRHGFARCDAGKGVAEEFEPLPIQVYHCRAPNERGFVIVFSKIYEVQSGPRLGELRRAALWALMCLSCCSGVNRAIVESEMVRETGRAVRPAPSYRSELMLQWECPGESPHSEATVVGRILPVIPITE